MLLLRPLFLLLALCTFGCGSTDGATNGTNTTEDADTDVGTALPDAESADGVTEDAATDTATKADAAADLEPSNSEALVVRFDGPPAREVPRGALGADVYRVTLIARRTIDLFLSPFPFSVDQVRESACAIGSEGAPNYRTFTFRDASNREALMSPAEVTGIPGGPRGMGAFTRATPIRMMAGDERTFLVTTDVRLTDPHCPFLGEGMRVTLGDPKTGRFFPAEAVGLVDEGRYARHGEITGNRLTTGNVITIGGPGYDHPTVSNERGQFWFCGDPIAGLPAGDANAYRGCCTNGRWRQLSDRDGQIHGGMLIRGSGPHVYYVYGRRDGMQVRAFFPTTAELNSWRHPSGLERRGLDVSDPSACLDVYEVPDEALIALPPGGYVTYRPASTYVRVATDPTVYAVAGNREIRPIILREGGELSAWMPARLVRTVPEVFFASYRIGPAVTLDGTLPADRALEAFDAPSEQIETTLR